jgi:hypothetical protein
LYTEDSDDSYGDIESDDDADTMEVEPAVSKKRVTFELPKVDLKVGEGDIYVLFVLMMMWG